MRAARNGFEIKIEFIGTENMAEKQELFQKGLVLLSRIGG